MVLNSLSLSFLAQASELGYDLDNAIVSTLLLGPQTPQDTARPKYSFFFLTVFFARIRIFLSISQLLRKVLQWTGRFQRNPLVPTHLTIAWSHHSWGLPLGSDPLALISRAVLELVRSCMLCTQPLLGQPPTIDLHA